MEVLARTPYADMSTSAYVVRVWSRIIILCSILAVSVVESARPRGDGGTNNW